MKGAWDNGLFLQDILEKVNHMDENLISVCQIWGYRERIGYKSAQESI